MLNLTSKDAAVTWSIFWRCTGLVMLVAVAIGALMGAIFAGAGGDVDSKAFKALLTLVVYFTALPLAWVIGVKRGLAAHNIDVNK